MLSTVCLGKRLSLAMRNVLSALLTTLSVISPGVVAAAPATYQNADMSKATEVLSRYTPPELSYEVIRELQDRIGFEKRRQGTQRIVNQLEAIRAEWKIAAQRMDRELLEVIKQAESDAVYRGWANFFDFVGTTAELLLRLEAVYAKGESKTSVDNGPPPREGQVMEIGKAERAVFEEKYGQWEKVRVDEYFHKHIYRPEGTEKGKDTGKGGNSGGSLGSILRGMGRTATAYSHQLSKDGLVPYCSPEWQGCVLVKEGGDDSWRPPGVLPEVPSGQLMRPPTEVETGLYRAIKDIVTPETATSVALDLIPVLGEFKSLGEVVVGKDLVTGEDIHRGVAMIGLAPGLGPKVKLALRGKVVGNVLELARAEVPGILYKKFPKIFVVLGKEGPAKLRRVKIADSNATVEITTLAGVTKKIENNYVHFTNPTAAAKIRKDKIIRASVSPDGSSKVYALKNDTLLKEQVGVAGAIGQDKSRAGAAIAFSHNNVPKRTPLKTGVDQYIFSGDVELPEGAVIMQKTIPRAWR